MLFPVLLVLFAGARRPRHKGPVIEVYGSRIGCRSNPSSFRSFAQFGFVLPYPPVQSSLSDRVFGRSLTKLGIALPLGSPVANRRMGGLDLAASFAGLLTRAVEANFSYELSIDGLRSYVPVGAISGTGVEVFTHFHFRLAHSQGRAVSVSVNVSALQPLGSSLEFSYSCDWTESPVPAQSRIDASLNTGFFWSRFHYCAVFQMAAQLLFLFGLIWWIYRQLISDSSNADFDDFDWQRSSDRGWKILHGDVFRPPQRASLLAALGGSSLHMAVFVVLLVFVFAMSPAERSSSRTFNTAVLVYLATAVSGGVAAVSFGNSFSIRTWLRLALGAVLVAPAALLGVDGFVGILSKIFGAGFQYVTKFGLIVAIVLLLPLFVLSAGGGLLAAKRGWLRDAPCQIAAVSRVVPRLPFYASSAFLSAAVGFFSTVPICIEIFYIISAVWNGQTYCSFPLLLLTIVLALFNTGGFTVLAVYLRLQCECYQWHWFSFLAPAASGTMALVCCAWFYAWRVQAADPFTAVWFLGLSVALSLVVAMLAGASGFVAANIFIRLTFSNLKLD
jgi:hypothetical protein